MMRWRLVLAATSLVLPFGCTAPNPAFNLEKRADSDVPTGGDEYAGASTSDASESTSGDEGDTAGEDHDGAETSDDTGNDTSSPPSCEFDECAPHEYCSFPDGTACGLDEPVFGVCKPRPEVCPPERDPVLACDCSTRYDNPCLARMDGLDIVCRDNEDGCVC